MEISLSILLIAVGAISVRQSAEASGIDLQVAGIILVVVGVIGLIASLVFWSIRTTGNRRAAGGQNTTIVERDRPASAKSGQGD